MISPYLNKGRSIAAARVDLRATRYRLLLDQARAAEAGNAPLVAEIGREIDAIDRRLRILEGAL